MLLLSLLLYVMSLTALFAVSYDYCPGPCEHFVYVVVVVAVVTVAVVAVDVFIL